MAEEKVINIVVNTGEARKSTKDLSGDILEQKKILQELERELLNVENQLKNTSKANLSGQKKLNDEVTHLKESLKDQKLSIKELSLEKVESIKIDKETNLNYVESSKAIKLLDYATDGYASKVVSLYKGFTSSLKALKGFNIGLSNMKKALISTGIGALVVALGLIVAYWDDIVAFLDKSNIAIKKQEELTASLNKEIERTAFLRELDSNIIDKQLKESLLRAKIAGKTENDIFKIKEKAQKDRIKLAEDEAKMADKLLLKSSKSTEEDYKKASKVQEVAFKKLGEERSALTLLGLEEDLRVKNEFDKNSNKDEKKDNKSNEKELKRIDDLKKIEEKRQSDIEKLNENFKKKNEDKEDEDNLSKIERQYDRDLMELEALDASELQKYELRKYYSDLRKYEEEKIIKEFADSEEKADRDLEDKRLESLEKRLLLDKKNADEQIVIQKNLEQAKANVFNSGLDLIAALAGKSKSIATSILLVQKGLAIAEVVTSSSAAIAKASANLASVPAFIGAFPNPAYAGQAIATVKGIATTKLSAASSIASILAQTVGGLNRGGSGGGATGGGGGADTGGGQSAPSFNLVQGTGSNQIAQSLNQSKNPIQAFVVGSSVTTQQSLDRNKIDIGSL
jgi:hypothetical protein